MEAVLSLLLIIVAIIALSSVTVMVVDAVSAWIEAKRKAEHPELWQLFDECDKKGIEECHYYNAQIAPQKRRIDAILREWNYYSADTRIQKEKELEGLRKSIESATVTLNQMRAENEAIRAKIHQYVEEHNFKVAKKWGW